MERCAYLVNSTPKYYGLLPLHFKLIQRYAPWFNMPLFLATEKPDHPICQKVEAMGVTLIKLDPSEAGFLDSRRAALQQLALTGRFTMVMPMQEDFLLDREPDPCALNEAIEYIKDKNRTSVRLMPCPGPGGTSMNHEWAPITQETDEYGFSFQATIWKLDACLSFYWAMCNRLEAEWPKRTTPPEERIRVEIRGNFAENADGQRFFWKFFPVQMHIGWKRQGKWANAVYLSPWPYRPTAIVQGRLEPWAEELGRREGMPIVL